MNRKEAMRQTKQAEVLMSLGFTAEEAESLRRISMTLRRWHELECGVEAGCIERDEVTNKPFWSPSWVANGAAVRPRVYMADRETGAKRRLAAIIADRNKRQWHPIMPEPVSAYIQTDPRGAPLYILRPGDVPEGADVSAYYSRGICVC